MKYISAFAVGGLICIIAQILIDKTKMTPARILTLYVVAGVILSTLGLYEPIVEFAGAGATVPIIGFGHSIMNGLRDAIAMYGLTGIFTGGLTGTAGGICAAMVFSVLSAVVFRIKGK